LEEVKALVNIEGEDREPTRFELFTRRTTACAEVFRKMTPVEQLATRNMAAAVGIEPNPPDIQQK
jgi:hypothetical protein